MFDIRINATRNAILCVLKGRFEPDEARAYVAKFKEGVDQLEPGFVVISDLTEFAPAEESARSILQEGIAYAIGKGRSRAIRILADEVGSQVGNLQLNRTARELGYEADVVTSLDEAKALLGWD